MQGHQPASSELGRWTWGVVRVDLVALSDKVNMTPPCPLRQNSCRLDRIFPGAVTKDGNGKVLGEIQSKSSSEIAAA